MISVGVLCAEIEVEDDGTLPDLIRRATEFVERQTGRYFGEPEAETYYLVGLGDRNLWLPEKPVADEYGEYDQPLMVFERAYPGADDLELDIGTDYEVRVRGAESRLVRLGNQVWREGYEYEVTYTRGYAVDTGPGDVRQVVLDLCALKVGERGSEGIRSESIGSDYQYT